MSQRWDSHFVHLALAIAADMSKDPDTKVGAVIVGPDREIRSTGFNGLSRGITDTHERLTNKELKRELMVHAEINAILNAARIGVSVKDCTLYFCATDDTEEVWGGPPCHRCCVELIQAGIREIVSLPFKSQPSRWQQSIEIGRKLLAEAGVRYREVEQIGPIPKEKP